MAEEKSNGKEVDNDDNFFAGLVLSSKVKKQKKRQRQFNHNKIDFKYPPQQKGPSQMQCLKQQFINSESQQIQPNNNADPEESEDGTFAANYKNEMLKQEVIQVDGKGLMKLDTMVSLNDQPMGTQIK